jgi:hypothetical protein
VIDASGVRREHGRTVSWAIGWGELASAGMLELGPGLRWLQLEPRDVDVVRRHRRIGGLVRRGATRVWQVDLGSADPAAMDAALARWGPQAQAQAPAPPHPPHQAPPAPGPAVPAMIDLRARSREARVLLAIGCVLTVVFLLGLLVGAVDRSVPGPVRLVAGGVGVGFVVLITVVWRTRDRPSRWLAVDHEGIRLLDGRRRAIVRMAWGDLAGVGLMTDENTRHRRLMAASLDAVPRLSRRMVRVPIWLELYPAGPDAVRRHPELAVAWQAGRPRHPGDSQRWLIGLGDGLGQDVPVGEHVRRWRPDLWRGHRSGSLLFG